MRNHILGICTHFLGLVPSIVASYLVFFGWLVGYFLMSKNTQGTERNRLLLLFCVSVCMCFLFCKDLKILNKPLNTSINCHGSAV